MHEFESFLRVSGDADVVGEPPNSVRISDREGNGPMRGHFIPGHRPRKREDPKTSLRDPLPRRGAQGRY